MGTKKTSIFSSAYKFNTKMYPRLSY